MTETTKEVNHGIQFVFEDMDDNTTFYSTNDSMITWKALKEQHKKRFTEDILSKLAKIGIKRIEIGSHAWYSFRKKTKGRFITLDTMFVARLLKR